MIENQIINKAIDYIFSHIDQELSVDTIADYCGYSKFYLTRLFKTETGESIYSFIKRQKLELSAWRLKVEKNRSITEIGNEYGYSASNYATLFREHFEKTPAQFRKGIDEKSFYHPFYEGKENKNTPRLFCTIRTTQRKLQKSAIRLVRFLQNLQ